MIAPDMYLETAFDPLETVLPKGKAGAWLSTQDLKIPGIYRSDALASGSWGRQRRTRQDIASSVTLPTKLQQN
jgi:hypothetical protein